MENRYAKIHLLDNPYCIDNEYTYFVPHDLSEFVKSGSFVIVPFGNSNKTQIGLVTEINCDEPPTKTKSIKGLASEEISFSETELELCRFMKEQTLCTIGDAVHSMIPAGALSGIVTVYKAVEGAQCENQYADVFYYIKDEKTVTKANLEEKFGLSALSAITYLLHKGFIEKDVIIKNMAVGKEKKYYTLSVTDEQLASLLGAGDTINGFKKLRSEMHKNILSLLAMRERLVADDIKSETGATDSQISSLLKKGYIAKEIENVYRNPYEHKSRVNHAKELTLSDEQKVALNKLSSILDETNPPVRFFTE